MIRRAGLTLAILSLVGLAVWAGAQAPAHQAIAQDLVIDPAAEAKADFSQLLNDRQPTADVLRATGPLAAQQYSETPFPRVTLYGGTNSSGWPLVGSWSTVTNSGALPLNQEAINDFSRFPMMILPATPLVDGRPDIVPALRAANPNNKIFGYAMGHTTWCSGDVSGNNSYPANYYYRHYWLAATLGDPQCNTQTGGLLWMQDGVRADIAPHSLGTNVNLAYRVADGQGGYTYPVAEGLAQVMFEDIYQSGTLDGIFIDVFCSTINWMEDADSKFDYVRAGYNDGIPDNGNDNQKPAVGREFLRWLDGWSYRTWTTIAEFNRWSWRIDIPHRRELWSRSSRALSRFQWLDARKFSLPKWRILVYEYVSTTRRIFF